MDKVQNPLDVKALITLASDICVYTEALLCAIDKGIEVKFDDARETASTFITRLEGIGSLYEEYADSYEVLHNIIKDLLTDASQIAFDSKKTLGEIKEDAEPVDYAIVFFVLCNWSVSVHRHLGIDVTQNASYGERVEEFISERAS